MSEDAATRSRFRARLRAGLSARLLLLTIGFVMLGEVLIYAPSIGRYRKVYMEERIAAAHLASLALTAPNAQALGQDLLETLLDHARSHGIALRLPAAKALMLSKQMPPEIDETVDLREQGFFGLIVDAFATLARSGSRMIRVVGTSPHDPSVVVETVIDERPMRAEMYDFSGRILALSIVISLIAASLVYLSLQLMFVRPMIAITASMVRFRRDPEDARHLIVPSERRDELGQAQRELAEMQQGLRAALQQKTRLAALGSAVAKINHDLRNILATAQLVSDHLASSDDPKVKRVAPTLLGAIDRAVKLCGETLSFVQDGPPPPRLRRFDLWRLVRDIEAELAAAEERPVRLVNRVPEPFDVDADRDQLYRVLANLVLNAAQAGAATVTIGAGDGGAAALIEVADDGPGIPPKVQESLFRAFAGKGRAGGTGLGLAIARDLMRGHGGDIVLAASGADGTVFRLELPRAEPLRASPQAPDRAAAGT